MTFPSRHKSQLVVQHPLKYPKLKKMPITMCTANSTTRLTCGFMLWCLGSIVDYGIPYIVLWMASFSWWSGLGLWFPTNVLDLHDEMVFIYFLIINMIKHNQATVSWLSCWVKPYIVKITWRHEYVYFKWSLLRLSLLVPNTPLLWTLVLLI